MQKNGSLKEPIEGLPHKVIYILLSTTLRSNGVFKIRFVPSNYRPAYRATAKAGLPDNGTKVVQYKILNQAYLNFSHNIKFKLMSLFLIELLDQFTLAIKKLIGFLTIEIFYYLFEDRTSVKYPSHVTKPKPLRRAVWVTLCLTMLMMVPMVAHPLYWISLHTQLRKLLLKIYIYIYIDFS